MHRVQHVRAAHCCVVKRPHWFSMVVSLIHTWVHDVRDLFCVPPLYGHGVSHKKVQQVLRPTASAIKAERGRRETSRVRRRRGPSSASPDCCSSGCSPLSSSTRIFILCFIYLGRETAHQFCIFIFCRSRGLDLDTEPLKPFRAPRFLSELLPSILSPKTGFQHLSRR